MIGVRGSNQNYQVTGRIFDLSFSHEKKGDGASFDWYQASIHTSEDDVLEILTDTFSAETAAVRGIAQYDRSVGLFLPHHDAPICEISYGGNQGAAPHVKSTGHYAQNVSTVIRKHWPEHYVARVDSCYDFVGDQLYDKFRPILNHCHLAAGVFRNEMGFPENGRTFYLGSPKSPVRLRCYEKDKERSSKGFTFTPGHLRIELQVRPRTSEKQKYASLSPSSVWGSSRWSRSVIGKVLDLNPEPIKQAPPMSKTPEQRMIDLFTQYSRLLNEVGQERASMLLATFYAEGTKGLPAALYEPVSAS